MYQAILFLCMLIVAVLAIFLINRFPKIKKWTLYIFSALLFAACFMRGLFDDAFNSISRLQGLLSPAANFFMIMLIWITNVGVLIAIVAPFFKNKTMENLLAFVVPVTVILNVALFKDYLIMFDGLEFSLFGWRAIEFGIETILLGAISGSYLFDKIKSRNFKFSSKMMWSMILVWLGIMLTFAPQSILKNFFGDLGKVPESFNYVHRITIYVAIMVPLFLYFKFRRKNLADRRLLLILIAVAGFLLYFDIYTFSFSLTNLPIHLCNTAMVLMLVAYAFKAESFFYFTYFVNVIGAFLAILMPDISSDAFSMDCLHFYYNHWLAFFLPILGVALKVFPRPNFQKMRKAILIFTIYFVFIAIMNGYVNNYGSVDYFFLYGDFFTKKFEFAYTLKENFVLILNWGVPIKIFWLYDLLFYIVYVFMAFMVWLVYVYLYKIADHYEELYKFKRSDLLKIKELRSKMKGRPISEPFDPMAKDMIKVSHFSKRYGLSNVKAVDDFNLEVRTGEVFGFLGHNGAGKSTLIKSMVGIQSITEGSIEICGYDIEKQPLQAKLNIGYVSDNHAVYENLTGREYINYVADLYLVSQKDRDERIKKYLQMFDLEDAVNSEIKSYSHGMKQKICVIAALIHEPKVWILDEPLTGLDPTSAYQIKKCMREHADKGNIVFFSSHVIEVVEKVCDRIAIIGSGKIKGTYILKDLEKKGKSLEKLYLSYFRQHEKERKAMKEKEMQAKMFAEQEKQEKLEIKQEQKKNKRSLKDLFAKKSKNEVDGKEYIAGPEKDNKEKFVSEKPKIKGSVVKTDIEKKKSITKKNSSRKTKKTNVKTKDKG